MSKISVYSAALLGCLMVMPALAHGKTTTTAAPKSKPAAAAAPSISKEEQLKQATAYFDSIIAEDAQSWMFNRYDGGSMHNMQVIGHENDGQTVVVYGEYSYNGGSQGWVKARFDKTTGALQCLEFWDFQGQCRPLGRSPSQDIVRGFVRSMASPGGGGGGGGSSSNCDDKCQSDRALEHQINKNNEDRQQAEQAQRDHDNMNAPPPPPPNSLGW